MVGALIMNTTLPQDSQLRKEYPLFRGLLRYFPAALAGVARHSKKGNDKHNPGEEMHHARGKSNDHADCILRHLMDLSDLFKYEHTNPQAILDEANALAWRALALAQELHEQIGGAPLAPGAKLGCELDSTPPHEGWPNYRCAKCRMDPCACIEHG